VGDIARMVHLAQNSENSPVSGAVQRQFGKGGCGGPQPPLPNSGGMDACSVERAQSEGVTGKAAIATKARPPAIMFGGGPVAALNSFNPSPLPACPSAVMLGGDVRCQLESMSA